MQILKKFPSMSTNTSLPANQLKAEASKLVTRSNLQNGLPPSMRAVPLIAIGVGSVVSKYLGSSRNLVEDKLLGSEETVVLQGPEKGP
ncbi:hypothetical protein EMCG_00599 [[Emmonsia] crescens]|uniref:Uncharacterized protein n=1 Tax=[Emmonsia] crescens TaxID=73230 RepID=A0A0G2HUU7_9EURO|nr:hypothetical protein EMCG_00599 [Emmonsia crescens UAMH 3008]